MTTKTDLSGQSTLYFLQSNPFSTHKSKCCQSRWRKLSYKTHLLLYIIIYSLNGSKIHHCKPWCCFLSPIAIAKSQSWDLRSLDIQTGRSWLPIQWRIQKLFLQLKKKKIQLKKKETKVAPPEDPEVVPPAPRDEPKISSSTRRVVFSSRGSRSSSSCS